MSTDDYFEKIININGHLWKIVDPNQTQAQPTYKKQDVIISGGRVPNFASSD